MHADRAYWGAGVAPGTVTLQGNTITSANPTDATMSSPVNCTAASGNPLPYCTANQVAAYDLQSWFTSMQQVLPSATSTVNCSNLTFPINCTIVINWTENEVAINKQESQAQTANGPAAIQQGSYELFVDP